VEHIPANRRPAPQTVPTTSQSRWNRTSGILTVTATVLLAGEVLSPISPPLIPWPTAALGLTLFGIGWKSTTRLRLTRIALGGLTFALGLGGMRVPLMSALVFDKNESSINYQPMQPETC
jgi:hypothetical protein